jgi:hypothetical protein
MEHGSAQSSSAPPEESVEQNQLVVPANDLVEQGPVRLKQYLSECEQGTREPENLDLILDVSEHRANSESSLDWAGIAIRAANLAARVNPTRRHSYLYRAMLLRTIFIARQGSQPGHAILDPGAIVAWFLAELPCSPEEARQRSERWKDPHFQQEFANELERHSTAHDDTATETPYIKESLNDLLELQLLRYRLQLLRRLAETGELPADPRLNEWLQTARHLP